MADQIASMFAKVGADTSGFERGMDGIKRSINAFEQMSIGAFRRVGELAIDGIGKAMETVGTIVSSGIDFNAMQEQATVAFETMLGSADKAQAFLQEMQDFAKTTPFEYPDLLVASRRLMALGFEAEEVLPMLTNIGDAVAAMGGGQEMIDRVTTALGQMRAKGRVQAEEMMQLTENGIAGWDMLAKHLGVDVATAMEMVTKKQVDAATGIAAIQAGIATDFGGMMAKQSTTWGGLISNLKDSFGMLSGRVMQPFFDVAKKGLEAIVNLVSSEGFIKGIDNFVDKITSGIDSVMNVVERFRNEFSFELAILTSDNASFTEKLIAIWDMLAQTGIKLLGSLVDSVGAMLPKWLEKLGEWGAQLWQWIVDNTPEALAQLGKWAGELWNWIIDNAPGWAAALWNWAVETWEWIVEVTPLAVAELAKWGEALWGWLTTNLPKWVDNLAKWGEAAWKWLSDVIPIVTTKVTEWGGKFLDWVTTNSPTWQSKLAEWGRLAWAWLAEAIPFVATKIGEWGGTIFTWLGQNLPTFITTLLGWGTALWNWIGESAPKAIDALTSFVQGLRGYGDGEGANKIGQMVRGWAIKLWNWITTEAMPKIAPAMAELANAIWTAGGAILTAVGNLALELAPLLWEWITVATPTVLSTLWTWGVAVWGWFQEKWPELQKALYYWGVLLWGFITNATPIVLEKLAEWGGKIWAWVTENAPEWSRRLGEWATVIWGWVKEQAPKWGEKLMEWAGYAWDWLVGENGVVTKASAKLGEWLTEIQTWIAENKDEWGAKLGEWAGIAWEWLTGEDGVISKVGEKLGEWLTEIQKWFESPDQQSKFQDSLKIWAQPMWEWVAKTYPDLATAISSWWAYLKTLIDEKKPKLETNMAEWGTILSDLFGLATQTKTDTTWKEWWDNGILPKFDEINTQSKLRSLEWQTNLWTWIGEAVPKAIIALADFIRDVLSGSSPEAQSALTEATNKLNAKVGEALGKIAESLVIAAEDIGMAIIEGIWKGLTGGESKYQSIRQLERHNERMKQQMKDDFGINSPSRVFEGYGENIVAGLQKGYNDKWSTFTTGTETKAEGWITKFKNIFGIHSPSALFEGFGEDMMAGLAGGIDAASGMIHTAMGNISTGMTPYFDAGDDSSEDAILMRENNNLLRILIAELRNKNMTANVTVGGGGSYGSLVTHAAGMR